MALDQTQIEGSEADYQEKSTDTPQEPQAAVEEQVAQMPDPSAVMAQAIQQPAQQVAQLGQNLYNQANPLLRQYMGPNGLQVPQPQQQQQPQPEEQPTEDGTNLAQEVGGVVVGGAADAIESVGQFADLTGDTLKLGLNNLLGIDTADEENPFDENYISNNPLDIPDDWIPENKTALGQFGRGLVEFGLLSWATAGVGGAAFGGARLGTRGLLLARSAGAGVKGTRQLKFIGKAVKIGAEGGIADLVTTSSETGNIMNLANDHVPWLVPWFDEALAVAPEDNPWLARIKTVAAGAGMNYIGHGLAAFAKGSWAAARAKKAGKTADEANAIGNKVMEDDMVENLRADEQAHIEMAADRYSEGRGISRADARDEYMRTHLSKEEYDNFNRVGPNSAVGKAYGQIAEGRGIDADDVWNPELNISSKQFQADQGRNLDEFVNDNRFDGYEKATYRTDKNPVVKNIRESLADKKAGGEGRSYSPIVTESYLRAMSRGSASLRQYIDEVADDITDAAFSNVDNKLDWDQTKQLVLKQANDLLEALDGGGDIAGNFKKALKDPENYRLYADDGNKLITISPTQKAANVLVMNALAKQVEGIATGGLVLSDKLPVGRQAESLFDAMKVLMVENKKMGMMWGLDGKAQQAYVLSPTMKAAKEVDLNKMSKEMDEYFGQLHQLAKQARWNEVKDLMELHALSGGKVRTLSHIHEFLAAKWRGGRMDGVHIKGRIRQQLQSTFFNSILSGFKTAPKAILGTNMIAIMRPFQSWAGAMLTGNEKEMVIAAAQIDAIGRAFSEGWQMWKHNWDLGVHRKGQTYQGKFDVETDLKEWKTLSQYYDKYGTDIQQNAYGVLDKIVDFNTAPWVKYSQNAMGSGDAMARTVIGRMTMRQRAARAAIDAGVDFDDVTNIARKTEDNFRNEIFKRDKDGFWVVSDKGASMAGDEAAMTKALEENFKGFELISNIPGMKAFFPFVRTGFNYLDVTFQHTPLAAFSDKYKDLVAFDTPRNLDKYGIRPEDVGQEIALMQGRMAMGTAVMGMGTIAALSGSMTGDYPYTKEDADLWRAAGIQPNSFKVGNTYISYKGIEVFDTIFSMTANVVANSHLLGEDLTDNWIKKLTYMSAAVIVENSMLGGVEDLARLMNPNTSEELLTRTGAKLFRSHLPYAGLMSSLGNILDANKKEAETLKELIIQRDAIFKSTLPPKYDILSKDRSGKLYSPGPENPLLRILNAFSPIAIVPIENDKVRQSLVAVRYNLPETLSHYKGEPLNSLEKSQLEKYLSMSNLRRDLDNLVKHPDYTRLIEEYKKGGFKIDDGFALKDQRFYMAIDAIFRRYKAEAMQQVLDNNPDLLLRVRQAKAKRDLSKQGRYQEIMNLPK